MRRYCAALVRLSCYRVGGFGSVAGALRAVLGRVASELRGIPARLCRLAWRSSFRMASFVLLSVCNTLSTLTELRGSALASCRTGSEGGVGLAS